VQLSEDRLANLLGPWTSGHGPRSRRLGERLATLVEQGVLAEGTRLPTERALAARLGVSRTTVAAAYDLVRDRGLAVSRQGSGTEVRRPAGASRGPRGTSTMFASLGGAAPGVIDLSLAETPSAEPTRRLLAGFDPVSVATACGDTGYQPYGWGPLRADLADLLGGQGLPTSVDGLVVTTGAQQAIWLATQVLTRPGDTVLVEEATYPGALEVFRRQGLRVVPVPTDASGPLVDALDHAVTRLRPTLAYLIPVGNNPTGAVWSASRFKAVCARLAASGVSVIDDRVPAPLARPDERVPHLATRLGGDQVVTVGSLSKTAWAGLRTGWLVTSPRVATDVVAARIASELSPPVPSQVLARHLLPHLDELAAEVRLRVAESEHAARSVIEGAGVGWELPAMRAGAWLWATLPGHDGASLAAAAERFDVLVTPGGVFSADARQADRIRISVVLPADVVAEGAHRLVAAWRSLGTGAPPRRSAPASLVF